MSGQFELVKRDFEEEKLPTGHDFAFLGHIVHGLTPDGNRTLFEVRW